MRRLFYLLFPVVTATASLHWAWSQELAPPDAQGPNQAQGLIIVPPGVDSKKIEEAQAGRKYSVTKMRLGDEISEYDLTPYSKRGVLIPMGVESLSANNLQALSRFVREGGSVLIGAAEATAADAKIAQIIPAPHFPTEKRVATFKDLRVYQANRLIRTAPQGLVAVMINTGDANAMAASYLHFGAISAPFSEKMDNYVVADKLGEAGPKDLSKQAIFFDLAKDIGDDFHLGRDAFKTAPEKVRLLNLFERVDQDCPMGELALAKLYPELRELLKREAKSTHQFRDLIAYSDSIEASYMQYVVPTLAPKKD